MEHLTVCDVFMHFVHARRHRTDLVADGNCRPEWTWLGMGLCWKEGDWQKGLIYKVWQTDLIVGTPETIWDTSVLILELFICYQKLSGTSRMKTYTGAKQNNWTLTSFLSTWDDKATNLLPESSGYINQTERPWSQIQYPNLLVNSG